VVGPAKKKRVGGPASTLGPNQGLKLKENGGLGCRVSDLGFRVGTCRKWWVGLIQDKNPTAQEQEDATKNPTAQEEEEAT
jgi:hypothetical protein